MKKPIEKTHSATRLGEIYKDLIAIKITRKDSLETILDKFYKIMDKWEICQGNWSENGRTTVTPEWNLCWYTFKSHLESQLMWMALLAEPPKRLLAYGKKPGSK